jgi:predicted cupin superfamily sugar epimerase
MRDGRVKPGHDSQCPPPPTSSPNSTSSRIRKAGITARHFGRAASTAILFLLARGERSHWHRVDAVEIWHYHAGAPLKLSVVDGSTEEIIRLGPDIHADEIPQVTVPARAWQAAESLGDWTLVGCTVAPGFTFEGFELAPAGWSPRR